MNYQQRQALEEDSPAMADTIFKQASGRARQDPQYRPITLELTDDGKDRHIWGGADVFELRHEAVAQNTGRLRDRVAVRIVDKCANFIDHPDYAGLMLHIPSTERNLNMLATHHSANRWVIHQEDVATQVAKEAENIDPVRDDAYEAKPPEFKNLESTTDKLKRESEDLKRRNAELEKKLQELAKVTQGPASTATSTQPQPTQTSASPSEPQPTQPEAAPVPVDPADAMKQFRLLDEGLQRRIKLTVHEKHHAEIESMKASGTKRVDLTKEYQTWIGEEIANVHTKPNG